MSKYNDYKVKVDVTYWLEVEAECEEDAITIAETVQSFEESACELDIHGGEVVD